MTINKPVLSITLVFLIGAVCMAGPVVAHHSFAMFDKSQFMLVEGHVTAWNYNNPHSWLHVEATEENGETQTWSLEGASIVHAARQGVNGNTFQKGEFVRIVMNPLRNGRPAGAMCFVVKEDGSVVRPNDGTCDSGMVLEVWETGGWLENGSHGDIHPVADD
jgi:hypothetical protein